jgi:hypothetical protein
MFWSSISKTSTRRTNLAPKFNKYYKGRKSRLMNEDETLAKEVTGQWKVE